MEESVARLVNLSKSELKSTLTDALVEELSPIQQRLHDLLSSPTIVSEALSLGSRTASIIAARQLTAIHRAVGLSPDSCEYV